MNKSIILLFSALFFLRQSSTAQIILIKPNLGNCVKCAIKLGSSFNTKQTGIPTYLVFSSTAIADSSEIEKTLRVKENGMHLVFSDQALRYFKDGFDLLYFNSSGTIILQKELYSITENEISIMVKDCEKSIKFVCAPSKSYQIVDNNLLAIDNQTRSANLFTPTDTFTYKLSETLYVNAKNKFNELYPGIFSTTEKYLIEKPKSTFLLRPSQSNYNLHYGDVYASMQIPFLHKISSSSDTFGLRKLHALVKFHRDSCTVYPIHLPHIVDPKYWPKGYKIPDQIPNIFLGRNFVFKNDSTVIFTFTNSEKLIEGKFHKFLGEFILRNGVFYYSRQLNIDLPDMYKQTNIAYPDPYTYTPLWRVDYPYFTTSIYPSIINLGNEATYKYQFPFETRLPDSVKLEIEKSPLQNILIFKDLKRKVLYTISLINGKKVLVVLSNDKNLTVKKIIDLNHFGFGNGENEYFQVIAEKDIVYAADNNGAVRGYPLDLLLF